jgi:formylglycine-generating enzyme required for sulfatase activity
MHTFKPRALDAESTLAHRKCWLEVAARALRYVTLMLLSSALIPSSAHAHRVALLIGNAAYDPGRLMNPPHDVAVLAAALREVGFAVTTLADANQSAMKRAVRDFGDSAQGADLAFFYFSGHGAQASGENYLIPLQAGIRKESDYEIEAVSANSVLRQLVGARPKAAVIVLDACRDNPMAATTKGVVKGLGRMDAPTGSMIAFATAPNTVASDDGIYARTLARQIRTRGLELFDVFRNTSAEVRRLSMGLQEPRVSEVSITDRIYLAGTAASPESGSAVRREAASSAVPPAWQVLRDCAYCPPLVTVPGGAFVMGSPDNEPDRKPSEGPMRRVTVPAFLMGQTEVTQAQWKAVMGNNPSHDQACGEACPVERVSWDMVQLYLLRLSALTGRLYSLPSEAQWEYAVRAGSAVPFQTGLRVTSDQANFDGTLPYNGSAPSPSRRRMMPVASFAANAFGLYDMHGNAAEWVQDCYVANAYEGVAPSDGKPHDLANCAWRVLRGGSWMDSARDVRAAARTNVAPGEQSTLIGFRIARAMP